MGSYYALLWALCLRITLGGVSWILCETRYHTRVSYIQEKFLPLLLIFHALKINFDNRYSIGKKWSKMYMISSILTVHLNRFIFLLTIYMQELFPSSFLFKSFLRNYRFNNHKLLLYISKLNRNPKTYHSFDSSFTYIFCI